MQPHPRFPIPLVVARGDNKIKPVCVCAGEWVGAQCGCVGGTLLACRGNERRERDWGYCFSSLFCAGGGVWKTDDAQKFFSGHPMCNFNI